MVSPACYELDFLRAASWPGAAAPESLINPRPEPPRAPRRGPAIASWVVPPLALPVAPSKLSARALTESSTNDGSWQDTARSSDKGAVESDDEDDSEVCVFSLGDGLLCEDGDEEGLEPGPMADYETIGLGASWEPEPVVHVDPLAKGITYHGEDAKGVEGLTPSPPLGASPVLLSAIERMAAGLKLGRQRQTTV